MSIIYPQVSKEVNGALFKPYDPHICIPIKMLIDKYEYFDWYAYMRVIWFIIYPRVGIPFTHIYLKFMSILIGMRIYELYGLNSAPLTSLLTALYNHSLYATVGCNGTVPCH